MRLLLLARTGSLFPHWRDWLLPLAPAGWEVCFAPMASDRPGALNEVHAWLRETPGWFVHTPVSVQPNFSALARRLAAAEGLGWLGYAALTANDSLEKYLDQVAPDTVAVLGNGRAQDVFGPHLAAAKEQGLPCLLLDGWVPTETKLALSTFSRIVRPAPITAGGDAAIAGPLVSVRPDAAARHRRTRWLERLGISPERSYLLHLHGRETGEVDAADTLAMLLDAAEATDRDLVLLPDPLQGKQVTETVFDNLVDRARSNGRSTVTRFERNRIAPALLRRSFAELAGGAALITGGASTLLLDAAAAGCRVAALPTAEPLLRAAGQYARFAAVMAHSVDDLRRLLAEPQPVDLGTSIQRPLAEILAESAPSRRGVARMSRVSRQIGKRMFAAATVEIGKKVPTLPSVANNIVGTGKVELASSELHQMLEIMAAGDGPILIGPWISEVGFEVLYWIPFVRWCVQTFELEPERLIVCSRGGVAGWYADLAPAHYFDIFDLIDEDEFRDRTLARFAGTGGQKHIELDDLDHLVEGHARERFNLSSGHWLHPQLMYRLFRPYWHHRESRRFLDSHTINRKFLPTPQPELDGMLPEKFIAAKFYFRSSFPDTPETRRFATHLITRLSQSAPVVMMDTGLSLDDHDEFAPELEGRIHRIGHLVTGRNNLALQSEVIQRSELFVGTYGGLSYVPPLYGVPAMAFSSDSSGFASSHLETALGTFHDMGVAFTHLEISQADILLGSAAPASEVQS